LTDFDKFAELDVNLHHPVMNNPDSKHINVENRFSGPRERGFLRDGPDGSGIECDPDSYAASTLELHSALQLVLDQNRYQLQTKSLRILTSKPTGRPTPLSRINSSMLPVSNVRMATVNLGLPLKFAGTRILTNWKPTR